MSTLNLHHDEKKRSCIDLVDSLRSLGLEQDVGLPALAVIGDKGSGKSSVLEALSGVTLPRGRNYPLVLKLTNAKEGDEWSCVAKYQNYVKRLPNPKDVPTWIDKVEPSFSVNSEDLMSLEISSPRVPDVTVIDLPNNDMDKKPQLKGFYVLPQTVDNIKSQIKKLISKPETIIVVVVPCNMDIATTEAWKMAQEVDPNGKRTLGILTKADLVDQVKEKTVVEIVQNKVMNLTKGFMIVRCYDQTKVPLMDHNKKEQHFFKDHALFKSLYEDGHATVHKVAERLSQELVQHIEKYLPQLKEQIRRQLSHTSVELKKYGNEPPSGEDDCLAFFSDKLTTFTQDMTRLTAGQLLDLTDQQVSSVWRRILRNSEESFQCRLDEEIAQCEQKNSESGFSYYNAFEHVIKDHIKLLEEPAVLTLKDVSEMVKKKLLKLVENSFIGFTTVISRSQSAISDVTSRSQKAAESMLRTQFKMELSEVHSEGSRCSKQKRETKKSTAAQLHSHYQMVSQRLSTQIPMVICFHVLQEFSIELQKEMLQMLKEKNISYLLNCDYTITKLRAEIHSRYMRLTKAQVLMLSGL